MKWRPPSRTCPPASRLASCTEWLEGGQSAGAWKGVTSSGAAKAPCMSVLVGGSQVEEQHQAGMEALGCMMIDFKSS